MSRPYAEVIGDPIAQSKSPRIHNFWLNKLGIEAEYRAHRVVSGRLDEYIGARRVDADWRGCNVTMPHKREIVHHLGYAELAVTDTDAANCVVRTDTGSLKGYNTDIGGFLEPLRAHLERRHLFRMARVIGTGGAARAIIRALTRENFTIVLAGRDEEKARAVLAEVGRGGSHHVAPLDHFATRTDFAFDDRRGCFDLVVNATPLGMRGQPPLAFDWSHAPPDSIAYDVVTDPVETDFLRNARAAGFATIDGLAMLIGQAAAAFELFFGQPAPREHDAELRELLTA